MFNVGVSEDVREIEIDFLRELERFNFCLIESVFIELGYVFTHVCLRLFFRFGLGVFENMGCLVIWLKSNVFRQSSFGSRHYESW